MPRIAGVATANPKFSISQSEVKEFATSIYGDNKLFNRLLPVFDTVAVLNRNISVPLEWLRTSHPFTDSNDIYIETSLDLAEKVVLDVANQSGLKPEEFDVIFFMSTTGLATPSIEGRLFNRLKLNPHIKRIPIWGLGCRRRCGGFSPRLRLPEGLPKSSRSCGRN